MEESKCSIASRLQAVKSKSGKSFNQIAEETGLTNVYVAQLLGRQAQLKPDTAPKLRAALPGLPEELVDEMMKSPLRSYDPNLIQEPTVYRLSEAVMHFGESIKEIINEEFGDGIISAIDFYCSVDKVKGEDGKERVVVTFDGKYLPYTEQMPQSELDDETETSEVPNDTIDWYTSGVADIAIYITAAFRSSKTNEAYLFMNNEYVLLNYASGTTNARIVNGPLLICDGFPSLIGTAFGEYGIDCAFDSHHGNEAFIFSGKLCAKIDYADDKILNGPITITDMFPFFKGTVFENSIDAAFRSSVTNEAYLFKGDQYALINYGSNSLIAIHNITQGFSSLKNTIFTSGIDAAFASHRENEAYLFKGDEYALINFAPGTTDDYIIGGVKPILPNWPSSLGGILPRRNRGLDFYGHDNYAQDDSDYYDELSE